MHICPDLSLLFVWSSLDCAALCVQVEARKNHLNNQVEQYIHLSVDMDIGWIFINSSISFGQTTNTRLIIVRVTLECGMLDTFLNLNLKREMDCDTCGVIFIIHLFGEKKRSRFNAVNDAK